MTNLPRFYEDVALDAASADAAVDALRRIRLAVHAVGEVRADAAPEATREWRGRFRDEFDRELVASQGQLSAIEERLAAAIAEIHAGRGRAEADQALRLRQRAEHEEAERRRLERERNPPDAWELLRGPLRRSEPLGVDRPI
jgi:hypothetical protein